MYEADTLQEDVDGAVNEGGVDDGSSNDSQQDQDFLQVNERTRYKTREDAVKAFDEAGKRIGSLSQWEKIGKEVGITDPQHIKALVTEVLESRKAKEAASKQASGKVETDDEEQLTPEQQTALKWLKKNAGKAGYVPKEELVALKEELKAQISELQVGSKAAQQDKANARIEQGQGVLKTLLKEAKLPVDNARFVRLVENDLKSWLEEDPEREKTFWYGKPDEVHALIKEGVEDITPVFQSFKAATNANYASSKSTSVKTASKQLPKSGSAPGKEAVKLTGKKKSDSIWADANRRVQAMLDESQAGAE